MNACFNQSTSISGEYDEEDGLAGKVSQVYFAPVRRITHRHYGVDQRLSLGECLRQECKIGACHLYHVANRDHGEHEAQLKSFNNVCDMM